jgi:hypothetical protein
MQQQSANSLSSASSHSSNSVAQQASNYKNNNLNSQIKNGSNKTSGTSTNATLSLNRQKNDQNQRVSSSSLLVNQAASQQSSLNSSSMKRPLSYQQISAKKQKVNSNSLSSSPATSKAASSVARLTFNNTTNTNVNSSQYHHQNLNNHLHPQYHNQQQTFNHQHYINSSSSHIQQPFSSQQQQQSNSEMTKYGTINEITFFEKLKKALRTQQVYDNFLKCLALYNQDVISKSELIRLVEPFLGKFANLYKWFKDFVENKQTAENTYTDEQSESISGGSTSLIRMTINGKNRQDRIALPPGDNILLEIDYLSCKQYGASYRDISAYPQPISSGQTELCKQVLNSTYVSFPSWSEDSTFISSKKNQYEELIFRIEDERFEVFIFYSC